MKPSVPLVSFICLLNALSMTIHIALELKLALTAAKVPSCPEYEKLVILLLDEIHIKENVAFDENTGNLIDFVDLGHITNHLLVYERSFELQNNTLVLAKSMIVIMVRGLFSNLRYP